MPTLAELLGQWQGANPSQTFGGLNNPDAQGRLPWGTLGQRMKNPPRNTDDSGTDTFMAPGSLRGGLDEDGFEPWSGTFQTEQHGSVIQIGGDLTGNAEALKDPSKVWYDPKLGWITPSDNVKMPSGSGDWLDNAMPYLVAAGLGGPALGAAMGGGGAAAAGEAGFGVTGGGSVGIGAGVTGGGAVEAGALGGAAAGGAAAGPSGSYWGQLADSGGILTDAGDALGGAGGGMDTGAFDMGGSNGFGGSTYSPPGIGDYISGAVGSAVDSAVANPYGAARGVAGLGALLAANHGAGGTSSTGLGNPGDVNNIIETMANANRVNQSTPFGSRSWAQGPDGRWTATDAFSPEEQTNYEGVRGMNADVTKYAMQKLAALMAQPQKSYSGPFQWAGRTIGG